MTPTVSTPVPVFLEIARSITRTAAARARRVFVNLLLQPCMRGAQTEEGANVMKALTRKVVSNFKSHSSVISRSRVPPGSKKRSVRDLSEGQADVTAADARRPPLARKGEENLSRGPGPRYKVPDAPVDKRLARRRRRILDSP